MTAVVLVVGQDFAVLKAVRSQLVGYRLLFATSAEEAVHTATDRQPHTILVHVQRGTGVRLELCGRLRRRCPKSDIIAIGPWEKMTDRQWARVKQQTWVPGGGTLQESDLKHTRQAVESLLHGQAFLGRGKE